MGGLGFRCAVQLPPSAYLASAVVSLSAAYSLLAFIHYQCQIWMVHSCCGLKVMITLHLLTQLPAIIIRPESTTGCQRRQPPFWRIPQMMTWSVLRPSSAKESSAWLHSLPISSLGLRIDSTTVRFAVGLHLGSTPCCLHTCHHCKAKINHHMYSSASIVQSPSPPFICQ